MAKEVRLEKINEFEEALGNYQVSQHAQSILANTPLVILLGVFGSGRNSLINELVKTDKYHFIVSDTTRPPRVRDGRMEQDGIQYFFRNEEEVLADIQKGEFLEAEIIHNQQVSGISIRELERARDSGKVPINEVDLMGTVNILKTKPDTLLIFLVPPSYDEWIRRITARESMSDIEYRNRMITAKKVLESVLSSDNYKFVINDNLVDAVKRVDELITHGAHGENHHLEAREIAARLLASVNQHLNT